MGDAESSQACAELCWGQRPAGVVTGEQPAAGGWCADPDVAAGRVDEGADESGEGLGEVQVVVAEAARPARDRRDLQMPPWLDQLLRGGTQQPGACLGALAAHRSVHRRQTLDPQQAPPFARAREP